MLFTAWNEQGIDEECTFLQHVIWQCVGRGYVVLDDMPITRWSEALAFGSLALPISFGFR